MHLNQKVVVIKSKKLVIPDSQNIKHKASTIFQDFCELFSGLEIDHIEVIFPVEKHKTWVVLDMFSNMTPSTCILHTLGLFALEVLPEVIDPVRTQVE